MNAFSVEFILAILAVLIIATLNYRDKYGRVVLWLFLGASSLTLISLLFMRGTRIFVLAFTLTLLMLYNSYIRKISIRSVLASAVVIVLIFSFIGIFRTSRDLSGDLTLGDSIHSVFWESTMNFSTFLQRLRVYENDSQAPYLYGAGFLDVFTNLVPRPLLPDKEENFFLTGWGEEHGYMKTQETNFGSFVLGEMYINGGRLCIVFFFLFLGWLMSKITEYYRVSRNFPAQILYFIGLPVLIVHVVRDPLAITFKIFLEHVGLLALAAYLLTYKGEKGTPK